MARGDITETKVVFRQRDIRRLRRKYKPGQKLTVTVLRDDGEEAAGTQHKQYIVVKTFPYHLSCIDRNDRRRSFNYFELERITV